MKSVGEAMAIGRNFTEALQKALRSLESQHAVFAWRHTWVDLDTAAILAEPAVPNDRRLRKEMDAIRAGETPEELFESNTINRRFLDQLVPTNEPAGPRPAPP